MNLSSKQYWQRSCEKLSPVLKLVVQLVRAAFIFIVLLALYTTFLANDPRSYLLDVQTESTFFQVEDEFTIPVYANYEITDDFGETLLSLSEGYAQVGTLQLLSGAWVYLKRVRNGDLLFSVTTSSPFENDIENSNDKKLIVFSPRAEGKQAPLQNIEVRIENIEEMHANGRSFVMSSVGNLLNIDAVGISSGSSQPIISGGSIYILNNTIDLPFFDQDTYYEVGPFNLFSGDGLKVSKQKNVSKRYNLMITANHDNPGIKIVANGNADGELAISRLYHDDLIIKVSVWQKLMNDKILVFLWTVLIFLFPFLFNLY